eukprot:4107670-Prymnesium_polylepis.1
MAALTSVTTRSSGAERAACCSLPERPAPAAMGSRRPQREAVSRPPTGARDSGSEREAAAQRERQ